MFLVVILYALFASVFTLQKAALEYTEPFFLVGSRMVFAGVLLLSYHALSTYYRSYFASTPYGSASENFKLPVKNIGRLLCLAVFNIYLTNTLEVWGLKYLTTAKTCFFYSLSPYFAALLCYFLFNERLTRKKWLGLIVGFVGFIPILASHTQEEELLGSFFVFSWPELAVMGAAFCSVYGWILLRQLIKENQYSPMFANGFSMLVGGCMALAHSYGVENWDPVPVLEFQPFIECTLLLLLISNLIAYNFYGYLLKRFSATFLSFAGFITPLITAFFGWIFLGETISWPFYLSTAMVFSGLFVFYYEELKVEYAPMPQMA